MPTDLPPPRAAQASTRTLFRTWLGLAQMGGAVFSAVLLIETGINRYSVFAAGFTTGLTAVSRILYRGK